MDRKCSPSSFLSEIFGTKLNSLLPVPRCQGCTPAPQNGMFSTTTDSNENLQTFISIVQIFTYFRKFDLFTVHKEL